MTEALVYAFNLLVGNKLRRRRAGRSWMSRSHKLYVDRARDLLHGDAKFVSNLEHIIDSPAVTFHCLGHKIKKHYLYGVLKAKHITVPYAYSSPQCALERFRNALSPPACAMRIAGLTLL